MRIIKLNNDICTDETVIGLGNFDGLHLGHQSLIKNVVKISRELNIKSSVILFDTHTNNVIRDSSQNELTSLNDKIEILDSLGIDIIFLVEFSDEFRSMSADDFINRILVKSCNVKAVVVGNDYTFGYGATGNTDLLRKKSANTYKLFIIDDYNIDLKRVSSSSIRKMIAEGDVSSASDLLGRYYSIKGRVIRGDGRGKKLGFPTANLNLIYNYVIPQDGVYITIIKIGNKRHFSLTSIGNNPTFDGQAHRIEAYIDNFNDDIYGETIELFFVEYIRPMIKFKSYEELIERMNLDLVELNSFKLVYNQSH